LADPDNEVDGSLAGRRGRWVWLLLAALVAFAVAVRVWDASERLHGGKTFDERFSVANVRAVLAGKGLAPKQAYYPSLSYLPQAATLWAAERLHHATGLAALAVRNRTGRWTPTAYFLCRLTNVAFGGASLVLVFLVGRRLFGEAEGLAAAAVLGAFRRHVISSAHFKPDVLVLLLTLLTFYWALLALSRPGRLAFARAGAGVGLAAAAKYTGVGGALVVTAAALVRWRDRRVPGWLLLAGSAAVATFLLLNPWVGDLYRFLVELVHGYSLTGVEEQSSPWVVLRRSTASVLGHHGWPAWFVIGGLAALSWRVARPAAGARPWSEERRRGALLLLVQTVGYALAHAAVFPVYRAQNVLPLAPFTSLVAGWAMVEAYRWLARRWPVAARPAATTALASIAALSLAWKPAAEVYERAVPTTWEAAAAELATGLEAPSLRSVVYYGDRPRFAMAARHRALLPLRADPPRPARAADARLADAEVFATRSPPGTAHPGTTRRVTARAFTSRGDTVTLVLHPWRLLRSERLPLGGDASRRRAAALPADLTPGTPISIALWRAPASLAGAQLVLQPGGRRLPLFAGPVRRGPQQLVTRRFLLPAGSRRIEVAAPSAPLRLELHRWQEPVR
jgi:hypothetical protein